MYKIKIDQPRQTNHFMPPVKLIPIIAGLNTSPTLSCATPERVMISTLCS